MPDSLFADRGALQTAALALLALSVVALLLLAAYATLRRAEGPLLENPDRPLPNLVAGWLMLWAVGAILLYSMPLPNPIERAAVRGPFGSVAAEGTAGEALGPTADRLMVSQGCGGCHALEGVDGMMGAVGPPLDRFGQVAAARIDEAGYEGAASGPADYIRESILEPARYVVPDYGALMPATFGETLTPEELELIVDYLAALGREEATP